MSLQGAHAKLTRATQHLDELRRNVESVFEREQVPVAVERGAAPFEYFFIATRTPDLPLQQWSLIVGDCVHNARAALDYVAWEASGAAMADTETQFPIFTSPEGYAANAPRRIARMPSPLKDFVRRVQPFAQREGDDQLRPLAVLGTLDNRDKHKLLQVVAAQQRGLKSQMSSRRGTPTGVLFGGNPDAPVEAGAVLAGVRMEGLVHDDVEFEDVTLTLVLMFGESVGIGSRVAVLDALDACIATVRNIVTAVEDWKARQSALVPIHYPRVTVVSPSGGDPTST